MSDRDPDGEPHTGLENSPVPFQTTVAPSPTVEEDVSPSRSPSLALLYGLLALALVFAIAFAWLILRPFHLGQ